jgi:hypothetical protein
MKNTPEGPSSKPSLESLLRLKRAERPDDAFWADFSVGMRQKQLAAIIEPKPWWLGASIILRRFSFPAVVATSSAAALVAFTVVRSGSPVDVGGFSTAYVSVVEVSESVAGDAPDFIIASSVPSVPVTVALLDQAIPFSDDAMDSVLSVAVDAVGLGKGDDLLSDVSIAESDVLVASVEASAGVDAATVTASVEMKSASDSVEAASRDFASVSWVDEQAAGESGGFAAISAIKPASYAFDPSVVGGLAGVVVADEGLTMPPTVAPAPGSRFERLLTADASKVAANSGGTLAQVRDRVLHHIGREEDLYASVSRLGVGGDRLSLRF